MRVEYHPALEQELRDIVDYYNQCSQGLGHEFLNEFEKEILSIAAMPKRWRVIDEDSEIRRALIKRFPYLIYYRVLGDERVRVTVVKHQRRHPAYGLERK